MSHNPDPRGWRELPHHQLTRCVQSCRSCGRGRNPVALLRAASFLLLRKYGSAESLSYSIATAHSSLMYPYTGSVDITENHPQGVCGPF